MQISLLKCSITAGTVMLLASGLHEKSMAMTLQNGSFDSGGIMRGTVVDSANNMEWLDLSETFVQNSFNAATTNYGGFGFRIANRNEVNTLLNQFFIDNPVNPGVSVTTDPNRVVISVAPQQINIWNSLFGFLPGVGLNQSLGAYNDGQIDGFTEFAGFQLDLQRFVNSSTDIAGDIGVPNTGVFMVRDIETTEVPTPALLLGTVGMSIAALRNRKQQVDQEV